MQYMRAHGNTPGPTQRPLLTGAISGVLAEIPSALLLYYSGASESVAAAFGVQIWIVFAASGGLKVLAGLLYAAIFKRSANDREGGWLFGAAYGFLLWMLGPVTILQWSFVRDDQPRSQTCRQIALAIRDEVSDLEAAGAGMIQIDEAALREGLPLRTSEWKAYLDWAVDAFRLCSSGVRDETQIHTHMCYSEFNDIIGAIGAMDADVISIETSRSKMELLDAFRDYRYPNEIGPGVYDIHSPRVPEIGEMTNLLKLARARLADAQIWINPDCGLKTRKWEEVRPALVNMVAAARQLRAPA